MQYKKLMLSLLISDIVVLIEFSGLKIISYRSHFSVYDILIFCTVRCLKRGRGCFLGGGDNATGEEMVLTGLEQLMLFHQ